MKTKQKTNKIKRIRWHLEMLLFRNVIVPSVSDILCAEPKNKNSVFIRRSKFSNLFSGSQYFCYGFYMRLQTSFSNSFCYQIFVLIFFLFYFIHSILLYIMNETKLIAPNHIYHNFYMFAYVRIWNLIYWLTLIWMYTFTHYIETFCHKIINESPCHPMYATLTHSLSHMHRHP